MKRRRRLNIESFESRRLMAAYINEIHFDPLFGDKSQDQYIELRGTPNAALPTGTFLVAVGGADGVYELGDVHAIFDLSRQTFGSNGLMVIMQSGGGYDVDSRAHLLKGSDGFLGGSFIFSADGNAKQIRTGSNNFMLIESQIVPTLTTDIDSDDDGTPDGAVVGWTILDSVAVFPWVENVWKQRSYSQITFSEDGVGVAMSGTTFVQTDQLAYVARLDRSTGYEPEDWVAGNTVEQDPTPSWRFQLQHGVFGAPRPFAYGGRFLDHVGSENWVGAISGTVFQDDNKDGVQQPGEVGVGGVTIEASLNGEANQGVEINRINPDDYPLNSDVSNASPYVTIVSAGSDNVPQGFKIRVVQRSFSTPGDYIFAHEGVGFFNENRRMRMDFYHPANGVSIDFIGNSDSTPTYGRLEIFNSANQSLGWVRTDPLGSGKKQRLSLNSNGNIAWALAYPEDSYLSSSPFGMLENLEVIVPEHATVSDANGRYSFNTLPSSTYSIRATKPNVYDFVYPNALGQTVVSILGNETVVANFGLQGNRPPNLDNVSIGASELLLGGSVIGTLPVALGYPSQRLKYTILSGDPDSLFTIDALTGQLRLQSTTLDFESRNSYTLNIRLEDTGDATLSDTALIEILVEDGNEAPVPTSKSALIPEVTTNGANVTTMTALDPDAGTAGSLTWSIVSGNVGGAFAIDSATGAVTVQDATKIDFEQLANYVIVVRVTDKGTPALSNQATLSISITNVNEAPVLLGQALSIKENSVAGTSAGIAAASDPDRGQSLQWEILTGPGSNLFEVNPANGEIRLASGAQLNFEQTAEYSLDVKVIDSGSPTLSATRTIRVVVVDDNDAPTLSPAVFTMDENSGDAVLVGKVQGQDEDSTQTLKYSLSGNDATNFIIDENSGEIRTASGKLFDFETKPVYQLTVTATDSGEDAKSIDSIVTVNLSNVNEAPLIVTSEMAIPENSLPGEKPGSIEVQDADAGDTLTWSILSQSQNWVTINPQTGVLTIANGAVVDFEGNRQNVLSLRVTDASGLSATNTITLTAADRNDAPTSKVSDLGSMTAKANQLFSYTLPADSFSDPDANDQLNIFVTLANGFPLPGWLSYNSATRVLSGTPSSTDSGIVAVKFTAIDQGGASASTALAVKTNFLAWNNTVKPLDVNNDTRVTALDALLVINYLNTVGPGAVPANAEPIRGFLDCSADNSVTALDALKVINNLNQVPSGEGEFEVAELSVDQEWVKRVAKLGDLTE